MRKIVKARQEKGGTQTFVFSVMTRILNSIKLLSFDVLIRVFLKVILLFTGSQGIGGSIIMLACRAWLISFRLLSVWHINFKHVGVWKHFKVCAANSFLLVGFGAAIELLTMAVEFNQQPDGFKSYIWRYVFQLFDLGMTTALSASIIQHLT